MATKVNYVDNRYGKLLVLEMFLKERKSGFDSWCKCICDCGRKYEVQASALKTGKRTSCGCTKKYLKYQNKVYGELTVTDLFVKNGEGPLWARCACSCGNIIEIIASVLSKGRKKTCGCFERKHDLTGNVYNDLTAIRLADEQTSINYTLWVCRCVCGNEKICRSNELKRGSTTSCGCRVVKRLNLIGRVYGDITVLKMSSPEYVGNDTEWLGQCKCGKIAKYTGDALKNWKAWNCGCFVSPFIKAQQTKNGIIYPKVSNLLSKAKMRAEKEGIPYSLELNKVDVPTKCPVFGFDLELGDGPYIKCNPIGISIDKVIPCLGYVHENVEFMSWRANNLKNNATLEELILLGEWASRKKLEIESKETSCSLPIL